MRLSPARLPRRALVLASTALLLASTVAVAAPPPAAPAAKRATLSTGTTITWTGAKGFVLRVPHKTSLPSYGARLFLRGGTYAMVRMRPALRGCGWGACGPTGYLDYTRTPADPWTYADGRGADHSALFGGERGPELVKADYELYLLTDGEATLTFDRTDLPRAARSYRAAGRIAGGLAWLPVRCPTAGCDTTAGYAGRVRVGGLQVDVGRLGSVDVRVAVYGRERPPTYQYPNSHGVRACVYPVSPIDPASPDPADHPWGCEVARDDADYTAFEASRTFNGMLGVVPIHSGFESTAANSHASGKTYLGQQVVTAHDVSKPYVVAYGVWFTYGIS